MSSGQSASDARSPRRVFLIGYRGTGKSTVGRLLAERLGWTAIDSDRIVEDEVGVSIADLFARDGEQAFRDLEERVVASLCDRKNAVVSLGGGAVLRESTRRRVAAAGPVVWLTAAAETLARRIATDAVSATQRPRLTGLSPADEVRAVLAEREPIYRECATFSVDTEERTPREVAEAIDDRLGTHD